MLTSDLYALGFDPAERGAHYGVSPFDALKAQEAASAEGRLPPDVAAEVDKIRAADLVILHFPLWWFAPPAMIKGWCDRALTHGALHNVDARFDTGLCRGKHVLFCVTTGANAAESSPAGKEGDTRLHLWPLAYTFRYLGFSVYEPELLHGVHGYHRGDRATALAARLRTALEGQAALVAGLPGRGTIPFNADTDFDQDGRLRPEAPSYSPFIRHAKDG